MLKQASFEPYEFRIFAKDGQMKWIMETVTSIRHHAHRAVLGNFMDVSQKKIGGQLRKEKERLQGVLEMAGAVCHELTNPMQVVLTASNELTRQADHLGPREFELCVLIKEGIEQMSKTTRNLARITKYATKNYIQGKKIIDISEASGSKDGTEQDLP